MNNASIEVKNLSFSYNELPVLKNLSFNIEKNSFVSIIGPNGAGKSTLVNLLSKVLPVFNGEIFIEGKSIRDLNNIEIAKKIAVVPQYVNLGFNFSVYETILMGRYPYLNRFKGENHEDFKTVKEVMELTKTDIFKDRKYNELSGGEKQRVIIAQTLAQDSPIIILDEPTSHLDINFQIEFMELFYSLFKKNGKTILGIFHDINLAIQYSEKVILLKEGSIYCYGNVSEVINRPNIMSVFKSDVYVGKNPFTGKLYISPNFNLHFHHEKKEMKSEVKIHVIGGGGAASPILNMLHNLGYITSTGVVNNLDTDLYTAEQLGITFINEAPFSPISREAHLRNLELIKTSDVVILPCLQFGNGNFLNLTAVAESIHLGKKVIIIDSESMDSRDHVEGRAVKLYLEIAAKGAIILKNIEDIPQILKNLHKG
ncbi:MAG: ABC transporter ATP-binding protein [Actinobacteria bacterium]|nr:ABC transporter ATP-binding protein [Cyanobacteriota bacterium]MCL6087323.1 ABC transporter ATP-binding protein [Actinomycetota bacterium]